METIIIVGQSRFPEGDPGAVRMYSFAKTLVGMGYNVLVIGLGPIAQGFQRYKGIRYLSLRQSSRYSSYLGFSFRLIRTIKKYKRKTIIHAIILGPSMMDVFLSLKKYCTKNQIILIKDVTEWYSPSEFKLGRFSVSYLMNDMENRLLIDRSVRTISISTYLEHYFRNKKIPTERIPIYFDQSEYNKEKETPTDTLRLLYAGFPSKEANMYLILKGLSLLDDLSLKRLNFVLIGVSLSQVQVLFSQEKNVLERIMPSLTILGRVPRSEVLENLLKCDFTVLLRDGQERYAKAGFPTKVIESISNSVPVIMNFTSDISLYFADNKNCIEVKGSTAIAFCDSLRRALSLTVSEKISISNNAKELALKSFDKDSYNKQFVNLLK